MNTIVYDSRRIFWPQNAPANAIPIDIQSNSEISSAKTVEEAVQMIADDISCVVVNLPDKLNRDKSTLRDVIDRFNELLDVLNEEPKYCGKARNIPIRK